MIVGLLAAVPAVGATRREDPPRRPDLTLASGAVGLLGGRVHGSVTVSDSGDAEAPQSTVALRISGAGRSRNLRSYAVHRLKVGQRQRIQVNTSLPASIAAGSYRVVACADADHAVQARFESKNCLSIGRFTVKAAASTTTPTRTQTAPSLTSPAAPTTSAAPASTVPAYPVYYQVNTPEGLTDGQGTDGQPDYWVDVPPSYDASNETPETLLVWLHGCGESAEADLPEITPGEDRSYIAISIGGRDGTCWDQDTDVPMVLAAIANVKTHFNINPRRVIIAGYSSGGNLAYRTIFYNADLFAGILALNTSPFTGTDSTASQSLAAAAWKFNDVQLAHTGDTVYPLAQVQTEIGQMQSAGFPVTLIVEPGAHSDANTYNDLRQYLLPYINVNYGWLSPAPTG